LQMAEAIKSAQKQSSDSADYITTVIEFRTWAVLFFEDDSSLFFRQHTVHKTVLVRQIIHCLARLCSHY
jgi:hypothetical protein